MTKDFEEKSGEKVKISLKKASHWKEFSAQRKRGGNPEGVLVKNPAQKALTQGDKSKK